MAEQTEQTGDSSFRSVAYIAAAISVLAAILFEYSYWSRFGINILEIRPTLNILLAAVFPLGIFVLLVITILLVKLGWRHRFWSPGPAANESESGATRADIPLKGPPALSKTEQRFHHFAAYAWAVLTFFYLLAAGATAVASFTAVLGGWCIPAYGPLICHKSSLATWIPSFDLRWSAVVVALLLPSAAVGVGSLYAGRVLRGEKFQYVLANEVLSEPAYGPSEGLKVLGRVGSTYVLLSESGSYKVFVEANLFSGVRVYDGGTGARALTLLFP